MEGITKKENIIDEKKFIISASLNNLSENISIVDFFLIPEDKSEINDSIFFGNLIVFQNKFHLLLAGTKKDVNSNSLFKLELGELFIPSSELEQLNDGDILEITEITNLSAKLMAGNQIIASAHFSYELGKIKLEIVSPQKKGKEQVLPSEDINLSKNKFIQRFFNEYGFEKENLIVTKQGGNYV